MSIDLNLNSRNIATIGLETLQTFSQGKYFVQGLRGVGAEIAKHIVLNSGGHLCLYDDNLVQMRDLGSNFFLSEKNVGVDTRAQATQSQLKELNHNVKIEVLAGEITEDFLKTFNVVIFSDCYDKTTLLKWNSFCRANNIRFIYCGTLGLYYFSFNDFGDEFTSFDPIGRDLKKSFVKSCTMGETSTFQFAAEEKDLNPKVGDTVLIKKTGISEIDGKKFKVLEINEEEEEITLDCNLKDKEGEIKYGIIQEVRMPKTFSFKSLEDSLFNPGVSIFKGLPNVDQTKPPGFYYTLHLGLAAILDFYSENQRLPSVENEKDIIYVLNSCQKRLIETYQRKAPEEKFNWIKVENEQLLNMMKFGDAQTCAQASILGGKVGQEVVKTVGKFSPQVGFIHADNFEIINEEFDDFDTQVENSRYDDYITIFGKENLEKFKAMNLFLVGAGAIGCEFLKIAAVSGFCCGPEGLLTVTDDDIIQESNRTRQFLFHKEDVKKFKSQVACFRAHEFNNALNVASQTHLLTEENEHIYNDDFMERQTALISGVDNTKARQIMSSKAVLYRKPFFESGTQGSRCHSQVIVPFLTEAYKGEATEEVELGCTLKTPSKPEHCIQYAKNKFELHFKTQIEEVNKFLGDKEGYLAGILKEENFKEKLEALQIVNLIDSDEKNFVQYALKLYKMLEVDEINQTLSMYPADYIDKDGKIFWTTNKPRPRVVEFDSANETHVEFILNTCKILTSIFERKFDIGKEFVLNCISEIKLPAPLSLEDEVSLLQQLKIDKKTLKNVEFEKDDDENGHIGFIQALSNIRCDSYNLERKNFFETKLVAGKIIPAISTSTSFIVGQIAIELMKYTMGTESYNLRNSNSCLNSAGFNLFDIKEPERLEPPRDFELIDPEMNVWSMIELNNNAMTVQELIDHLTSEFKLDSVDSILFNGGYVYKGARTDPATLKMTPKEVIEAVKGVKLEEKGKKFIILNASCEKGDVSVLLPPIKYGL